MKHFIRWKQLLQRYIYAALRLNAVAVCGVGLLTFSLTSYAVGSLAGVGIEGHVSGGVQDWPTTNATVGPGVEFQSILTNATIAADFTPDTVTISYENTSNSPNVTIGPTTFTFDVLTWNNTPRSISGLTELATTFDRPIVTQTTAESLQLDVGLQNTNPGDVFSATFDIVDVPEPSTCMLMGTALVFISIQYARRRKRSFF